MAKSIYLTDAQYLDLLKRARAHLDTIDEAYGYDSTVPGCKFTDSNIGLCNDSLTTLEIAMWPEDFPTRPTMKYRKERHKCPLDWRTGSGSDGCFYTCLHFRRGLKDLDKIKALYDQRIKEVEDEHSG